MTTQQLFEQLTSLIPPAMQRLHVPGVAIGILSGDQQYSAGFGVTNLENPLPVNAETLFQVGSISKTVTATAMMRLVERGLVDLDVPIRTYLPDLRLADRSVAERVTLRHIFTHTAGWMGDYFDDAGLGDDALDIVVKRMDRLPQITPLGEIWSYNNAGYYLAGRVIEVVTGKILRRRHPRPGFKAARDVHGFLFCAGCHHLPGGSWARCGLPRRRAGASSIAPMVAGARSPIRLGGLVAPVSDMLRYARFHMGDGKRNGQNGVQLLRPETVVSYADSHCPGCKQRVHGRGMVPAGGRPTCELSATAARPMGSRRPCKWSQPDNLPSSC